MRRLLAAVLTALALVAATGAWAGWVVRTVTTPERTRAIVGAVLDDPVARAEVVRDLNLPDPDVEGLVSGVLADDGYQAMITEAAVTVLTDPSTGSPVADARSTAGAWTLRLALTAGGLLATAAAVGRRRRVLRRAALWCLGAGAAWFALPAVARWAASRWYPDHPGVIAAAVAHGFGATPAAVVALLVVGGVGLVASLPWRRRHRSQPTLRLGGAVAEGTAA